MSVWSRFRAAFSGGALTNPDSGNQSAGPMSYGSTGLPSVTDERAMSVSAVWACTRLISQSVATMPMGFYRKTATGREPLPDDHYLAELLRYRPNAYMSGKQFRMAMLVSRVLWGNAFALKRMAAGRVVSLLPLKPEFMEVERTEGGIVYTYNDGDRIKEYGQDEIMHIRGMSADGIVGMSPLAYMRYTLGISVAADSKAARSFNGRPSAVLKAEGWPTQEQREQLRQHYGNIGTDGTGDGQWWLLPGNLSYQAIGLPPDDLQMLESRQFQVAEIARFYGVPTVLIDGQAGSTAAWPASYEQQMLAFLQFTLRPYLEEFEDAVTADIVKPSERKTVYAEHNVEGFLRTDSQARAAYYASMLQNGVMTRAEVRRLENLPHIDGTDELTVQLNMTTVDKLGEDNAAQQSNKPAGIM